MRGISDIQKRLGYEFNDNALLIRALTHRSKAGDNYERLEFLGDSILGFLIAECLYIKFPDSAEGKLSRMRSALVRKESLAEVARGLRIQDALILGEGERKSGGFNRESILADAMEAILGAVYLDASLDDVRRIVLRLFSPALEALSPEQIYKDPKSRLQEYLQQRSVPVPVYKIVSVDGEPHCQTFEVACVIEGQDRPFIATGSSRRNAEQSAAEQAFVSLNG